MSSSENGDTGLSPAVTAVTGSLVEPRHTEAWWCRRAVEVAARLGVRCSHWCSNSSRCAGMPGLPDLILAGPAGVMFREVKVGGAETTAEQDLWAYTLTESGQDWAIWDMPRDWPKAVEQMCSLLTTRKDQ